MGVFCSIYFSVFLGYQTVCYTPCIPANVISVVVVPYIVKDTYDQTNKGIDRGNGRVLSPQRLRRI